MGSKKLCSFVEKKGLDKDSLVKYAELVKEGKYVCKKCGRVANDKDYLCKPKKIENIGEEDD